MVVGSIGKPFPANFHAATSDSRQPNPSLSEIPLPPGPFIGSHGNAINNSGDVVGTCWTEQSASVDQNAFIFTGGVSTDLNNLIPGFGDWKLQSANDINDKGQIVGNGLLNGNQRAFLLTPNPFVDPKLIGRLIAVLGTIIGGVAVDGGGIVIVGGVPIPVGPWGERGLGRPASSKAPMGDYAAKSDILISLSLEELATHIGNAEGRIAIRRAALEAACAQIQTILKSL